LESKHKSYGQKIDQLINTLSVMQNSTSVSCNHPQAHHQIIGAIKKLEWSTLFWATISNGPIVDYTLDCHKFMMHNAS